MRGKDKASESAVMRPGCGLKFREGWFLARHTPTSAPTSGGKDPITENPKAFSPYKRGRGGLGPGSLCDLCPKEGRREERERERESEVK